MHGVDRLLGDGDGDGGRGTGGGGVGRQIRRYTFFELLIYRQVSFVN